MGLGKLDVLVVAADGVGQRHQQEGSVAQAPVTRRSIGGALLVAGLALQLVACQPAAALACPGMRGYALQQCLREERKRREAEEGSDEQQQEQQGLKYEQPGELVTLPSGLQYREISVGSGPEALLGLECDISYTVYRLSSGGYYKYSGGGTPVYMWSVGYGQEGRDDLGDTYRFRLGDPSAVPSAVAAAMLGMRAGGRRRVLVPPGNWTAEQVRPLPLLLLLLLLIEYKLEGSSCPMHGPAASW
uniref:peptidylprolyl isomerase n=1 Tax=Tetradesmus obliquus TaxID=3088 RepID=A0A383WF78_TETOB|eukprot:jgi/Sobl393_1/7068/SZX75684.1